MKITGPILLLLLGLFLLSTVQAQQLYYSCNGILSTRPNPNCRYPFNTGFNQFNNQRYYSCNGGLYSYPFQGCTYPFV
ncbi:hypothetical protein BV898_16663 [Hypsibius exemplaris]|uniref:Chitin-binding type-2 domain-containing protein n=1 Tax=Hypsibius exemplaris TaxID=2072580 RepID=A0A9X6RLH0_HYPEX|nr:hypothetical protein BV898_16663 [Hypsibius exemplaris]